MEIVRVYSDDPKDLEEVADALYELLIKEVLKDTNCSQEEKPQKGLNT